MIHHVSYFQLNEPDAEGVLEEMVRASRTWLLKIPEVLSVKSGRNLDPESEWHFFYNIETDSRGKLQFVESDPNFLKFTQDFIKPNTRKEFRMEFELDPSRELKYS
ncbi:Dabb family protein [Luteolibacter sp. AS25]|uniref:Dabb family protein n=1 Tax=Luteolibacter sp. AS25 TaxID=3135776 RepID=UPI00398AF00E